MSMYRQYAYEKPKGEPVAFGTAKQRRALIGKRISWNERGWIAAREGVVQEARWKNIMIDNDWRWAPDMINVHVID